MNVQVRDRVRETAQADEHEPITFAAVKAAINSYQQDCEVKEEGKLTILNFQKLSPLGDFYFGYWGYIDGRLIKIKLSSDEEQKLCQLHARAILGTDKVVGFTKTGLPILADERYDHQYGYR